MKIKGSCHCGAVRFSVHSSHPYPFNLCYCSICRKTAGGGGYAINLGADFSTLEVSGEDKITVFHARIRYEKTGAHSHDAVLQPCLGNRSDYGWGQVIRCLSG